MPLGNITKKPMQRDLFTGEIGPKPKSGNGHHIKLHREADEPIIAPGMAYFPATGPEGKRCNECMQCQGLHRSRAGRLLPGIMHPQYDRTEDDACKKAAEITGTVQRGGIGMNRACKYFESRPVDRLDKGGE